MKLNAYISTPSFKTSVADLLSARQLTDKEIDQLEIEASWKKFFEEEEDWWGCREGYDRFYDWKTEIENELKNKIFEPDYTTDISDRTNHTELVYDPFEQLSENIFI